MSRLLFGTHKGMEAEADELLLASLEGVTSREEKSDILTPWKLKHRKTHEVLVRSGVPDPSIRIGMFNRSYNNVQTHLNSYDGPTRPMRYADSWDPYENNSEESMPGPSWGMQEVFGVDRDD
jgi:hypothetical protein